MREECPNCGADLPPGARVCPECGSDENTGWSDAAKADGLGLPDDSFDYDEFVKREFESNKSDGIHWFWWIVAIIVLVAFLFLWMGR